MFEAYAPYIKRVFLENGDPFVLSADKLCRIAELVHSKLPEVDTIAMYASINNIKSKSDEDLRRLRSLGINELNIGVESGLDEALLLMNKGYSREEAITELLRLKKTGMDFGLNVIFGAAGSGKRFENALATAELVNQTQPYLLFTGTIHADFGCPLYDDLSTGKFTENTVSEYLEEEEIFLQHLNPDQCYYFGLHPSNVVKLQGWLCDAKENLLMQITEKRKTLSREQLNRKPLRHSEGAIFL